MIAIENTVCYSQFLRGEGHTMPWGGHTGSMGAGSEAEEVGAAVRVFIVVSERRIRSGRTNRLGLASLNGVNCLWRPGDYPYLSSTWPWTD